ncbi:hypothetical protein BAUCODRAFT_37252 [Baudoinia panamericana UAMH 10762]|uniref:RRM domain-containing protein n=1 Tax=Baudoinia panamericana (strain UAMH 10762) TaxID=717646 RepID=M2N3J5_BAUPA|nr:uncharacterized protein BAUCODRAFT_37252 [Baudoinia panamericana UAMH 10762]EMC93569.1 hypothetical protein BAUCODRAFT_37252 [Baudoinia panamericana UAMH 10762]
MYLLRRVASGVFTQQPLRQLAPIKSTTARVTYIQPITSRSFHQSQLWLAEGDAKRVEEASPADAQTSGETVTTGDTARTDAVEADRQLESNEVREESIATSDVADAAHQTSYEQPSTAQDAVSESSGTTSAPVGSSEAQPQRSSRRQESVIGQAQEFASSAAQTAQSAVSSATQAARNAFGSQQSQQHSQDFAPRAPAAMAPGGAASAGLGRTSNPPSRILYIGNLFFEVTAPQLEAEFKQFGDITNSRIVTDSRGLSKGFAYIEFSTQQAADQAVQANDQKVFQGRRMAVQYHVRREPRAPTTGRPHRAVNPPSKTLFIGNMSYQMSDRDLNDLFREIKNVLDVRVAIDRRSGQPRGFAHADFIDVQSAERAKEHLEKKVIYGRQLKIDFSSSGTSSTTREES